MDNDNITDELNDFEFIASKYIVQYGKKKKKRTDGKRHLGSYHVGLVASASALYNIYVNDLKETGLKLNIYDFNVARDILLDKFGDDSEYNQKRVIELINNAISIGVDNRISKSRTPDYTP